MAPTNNEQAIEHIAPRDLIPWAKNARTHSKKQIRQIAESIEAFGFVNPILIDEQSRIMAGHGRVKAALHLGLSTVPCLRFEYMSEDQKRAYVLADNQLALNAGWDDELLAEELGALLESPDLSFDVGVIGFSIAEIDTILDAPEPKEPGDPADDAVPDKVPRRVRPGDVWQLGEHRLVCGDALDPETVRMLMDGEKARMVFSDPPYNVPIDGHVGNSGKTQHREFAMATGEMDQAEFTKFLATAFRNMANVSCDGAIHFLCMDWRHQLEMLTAGTEVYSELKNLIVWVKDRGGMGTFYRSRYEHIYIYKVGSAPHVNTFELGQHGRYRTNVWEYRAIDTRKTGPMDELSLHPTCKPVEMIADAIRDVSGRNDIVLDVFGGSGSTLIAAEKTGRRARLIEFDPIYCDRILARWEAFAKDDAEQLVCGWAPPAARVREAAE